jgi:hypothetical protein
MFVGRITARRNGLGTPRSVARGNPPRAHRTQVLGLQKNFQGGSSRFSKVAFHNRDFFLFYDYIGANY